MNKLLINTIIDLCKRLEIIFFKFIYMTHVTIYL